MQKIKSTKHEGSLAVKDKRYEDDLHRRTRIEYLKKIIDNEEYLNDAISKLANSLTSGLLK